ncbi:MAG TPA: VOC family protein [Acidimicrobiia bacterium]|nr:VOC family protein [Acidimicrobiia bacterium]
MPRITPFLWFDSQAEEAAEFYCSIFPNSKITGVSHYSDAGPLPAGTAMTVSLVLDGQELTLLNGGPHFKLTEAFSLSISCADQDEVDRYWEKLTADGGEESQCGWLKDRYGLSWQVIPAGMEEIIGGDDPERVQRAMQAMFGMKKLDLAALQAAADGRGPG